HASHLTRRGGTVTVTWRPAVRAVGYDAEVRLPDGRLESHELPATARKLVISHVRGRGVTKVSLTALRAIDHRPGPAVPGNGGARKKPKPQKPAHKRTKHKH